MAEQKDVASVRKVQTHRWPTCVVTYQQLLMATCGGNCGQPLVSGAGPGYSTRRVVYDAETGRWFHIRCYDTCSEDDWAQHTRMFTRDSIWRPVPHHAFQTTQCQEAVRHWAFLRDLVPDKDLRVRCTPWSVAHAPGHMDRFFLDIGQEYARRSVWPECALINRPGGAAFHLDLMFPTSYWSQFSVFWTANAASDSVGRRALLNVAQEVAKTVSAEEVYATVDVFEPTQQQASPTENKDAMVVVLRLQVAAVEHSLLHYEPLHILSAGSMTYQLPACAKLLADWRQRIVDTATTVLHTTSKTKPETSVAKLSPEGSWHLQSVQPRASALPQSSDASTMAFTLAVGLTTNSVSDYYYTNVGSPPGDGLAQLHILRTNIKLPTFVPYQVSSGKGVQPEDIQNATQVTVTPFRVIKL